MSENKDRRPFKCTWPECKWTFGRSEHLKRHLDTMHNGRRPYECTLCVTDSTTIVDFNRMDTLQRHKKLVHTCKRCGLVLDFNVEHITVHMKKCGHKEEQVAGSSKPKFPASTSQIPQVHPGQQIMLPPPPPVMPRHAPVPLQHLAESARSYTPVVLPPIQNPEKYGGASGKSLQGTSSRKASASQRYFEIGDGRAPGGSSSGGVASTPRSQFGGMPPPLQPVYPSYTPTLVSRRTDTHVQPPPIQGQSRQGTHRGGALISGSQLGGMPSPPPVHSLKILSDSTDRSATPAHLAPLNISDESSVNPGRPHVSGPRGHASDSNPGNHLSKRPRVQVPGTLASSNPGVQPAINRRHLLPPVQVPGTPASPNPGTARNRLHSSIPPPSSSPNSATPQASNRGPANYGEDALTKRRGDGPNKRGRY